MGKIEIGNPLASGWKTENCVAAAYGEIVYGGDYQNEGETPISGEAMPLAEFPVTNICLIDSVYQAGVE